MHYSDQSKTEIKPGDRVLFVDQRNNEVYFGYVRGFDESENEVRVQYEGYLFNALLPPSELVRPGDAMEVYNLNQTLQHTIKLLKKATEGKQ